MKIAHLQQYGTPDGVQLVDIPIPQPTDNQVLVKIKAASLNLTDIEIIRGGLIIRLSRGIRKPKNQRLGCDLSGVVDAIGPNVSKFNVGDEIYADVIYQSPSHGALAEYIIIPEYRLRMKPEWLSFEEAATIAQAGVLALQGIVEPDKPQENDTVLINGAGGGVGSYAVQLAKHYGAEVTAVDHPTKFDFLQEIGADHVVSYLDQDFTKMDQSFDIVLDVIGNKSVWAYRRSLKPNGRYRMVGGSIRRFLGILTFGTLVSKMSSKSIKLLIGRPNDEADMAALSELIQEGSVIPQIDKTIPFDDVINGLWEIYHGKVKGKLVVVMDASH